MINLPVNAKKPVLPILNIWKMWLLFTVYRICFSDNVFDCFSFNALHILLTEIACSIVEVDWKVY